MPAPTVHADTIMGRVDGHWLFSKNQYGLISCPYRGPQPDTTPSPGYPSHPVHILNDMWHGFTDATKRVWHRHAKRKRRSGYADFMSYNLLRHFAGEDYVTIPQ